MYLARRRRCKLERYEIIKSTLNEIFVNSSSSILSNLCRQEQTQMSPNKHKTLYNAETILVFFDLLPEQLIQLLPLAEGLHAKALLELQQEYLL